MSNNHSGNFNNDTGVDLSNVPHEIHEEMQQCASGGRIRDGSVIAKRIYQRLHENDLVDESTIGKIIDEELQLPKVRYINSRELNYLKQGCELMPFPQTPTQALQSRWDKVYTWLNVRNQICPLIPFVKVFGNRVYVQYEAIRKEPLLFGYEQALLKQQIQELRREAFNCFAKCITMGGQCRHYGHWCRHLNERAKRYCEFVLCDTRRYQCRGIQYFDWYDFMDEDFVTHLDLDCIDTRRHCPNCRTPLIELFNDNL